MQRHRNLECTGGACVGAADQAWPPYIVDLHAAAPQRKDQQQCLLRHRRPQHNTNMRILPLIVLLTCLAWQTSVRAQDENEARAAPARGLLKRGLLTKGKATTTTTTPAPQDEAEYEDDAEYPEGEADESSTEAPPSSTEGKKLVAGGVRPFRSNTDLLEALKRRRAQAAEAKLNGQASSGVSQSQDSPAEAPISSKSSYSKKRFNTATRETNIEDAPAPSKPSRSRFGRPSSKSLQEAEPEEQNDATTPARTGRTFSRRGGN